MTPFLSALVISATIAGGSFAVLWALRFFPISAPSDDQYEMDLGGPTRRTMAHDVHKSAKNVRSSKRS